jgi:hypothetical protein
MGRGGDELTAQVDAAEMLAETEMTLEDVRSHKFVNLSTD